MSCYKRLRNMNCYKRLRNMNTTGRLSILPVSNDTFKSTISALRYGLALFLLAGIRLGVSTQAVADMCIAARVSITSLIIRSTSAGHGL